MLDKEEIETYINRIVVNGQKLEEEPTYELANSLDRDITVLRFIIGQTNFESLHYFKRVYTKAIQIIEEHDTTTKKEETK